jgi:RHS repeat-associated core domain
MIQPSRKYAGSDAYMYGFNGKENDNEVKGEGNQQDYGMRIYDPRLGKFLSVDPLMPKYPWYTPYQFAGNMPVQATDLDGGEIKGYRWSNPYVASHPGTGVKTIASRYDKEGAFASFDGAPKRLYDATAIQDIDGRLYVVYEAATGAIKDLWYQEYDKNGNWLGSPNQFVWSSVPNPANALYWMTLGPLVGLPAFVTGAFAFAGLAAEASTLATELIINGQQLFWRYAPTIASVGKTIAEFLDETGSLSAANKGGKLISTTFQEGKGVIGAIFKFNNNKTLEVLAEKVIEGEGKTLHLKDMVGYIEDMSGKEGANNLKEGVYDVLNKLKEYAKSQGFENLRITYQRVENSSSKTPGHSIDKTFKLNE